MLHLRRSARAFTAVAAIAFCGLGPGPALAQATQGAKAAPVFVNGMAQVVPAFQDSSQWIRQELWVETNFDSDHDGKPDRVHVDVTRPRQTETEGSRSRFSMGRARTMLAPRVGR
jgi:X-Pro dipeptidyl-peptidase